MNRLFRVIKIMLLAILCLIIITNLAAVFKRAVIVPITIIGIVCYLSRTEIKRRYKEISMCIMVIVTSLVAITGITLSRYTTTVQGSDDTMAARMVLGGLDSIRLVTSDFSLKPGSTLEYNFEVCNNQDGKRCEVMQEYTITLSTTNNLPIKYSLSYKVNGTGEEINVITDVEETTTSRKIALPFDTDISHRYTLKVEWSIEHNDYRLSDEVDDVEISIDSIQVN